MRARARRRLLYAIGLGVSFAAAGGDHAAQSLPPAPPPTSLPQDASMADLAAAAGAVVTSQDEDGVPKFLWAPGPQPALRGAGVEGAALAHLRRYARAFGVSARDLDAASIVGVYPLSWGAFIVHVRQYFGDYEVYDSDVKILLRSNLQLVAISGRPRAITISDSAEVRFERSAEDAAAGALSHAFGIHVPASRIGRSRNVDDQSTIERLQVVESPGGRTPELGPARKILFPVNGVLVPSYFLEFFDSSDASTQGEGYRYVVAADDGRVLQQQSLTQDGGPPSRPAAASFQYRVWTDADGRPKDGPQMDFSPHPTGIPDGLEPPFVAPNLVVVDGLQQPRRQVDPWLPADATETRGNNADAYTDHFAPDGFSAGDVRASVTSPFAFDRSYDTGAEPLSSVGQSMAAVTQAFYTVNWLHDYWYESGFNEAAGNAQNDNYGRGGIAGDSMRVEVQDAFFSGQRTNANMSTPSDGLRPRMQVFVWLGRDIRNQLTLTPGGVVPSGVAQFGPRNFNLTAPVMLANDGVGILTDACTSLPAGSATGKIVLVDRGGPPTCTFSAKAQFVQNAGGVGMLLANNISSPTFPIPLGGSFPPTLTIPALSMTLSAGSALKVSLAAGPVTARMEREAEVDRDGALDATLVAHEWGHYLHRRLAACATQQCRAISEGWGDFVALHLMARTGDKLDGAYPIFLYSAHLFDDDVGYFGVRRVPYSVDFSRNALSFRHISNGEAPPSVPFVPLGPNSEVHNAGEVWASMMWEAYVALLKTAGRNRDFDAVRRRMSEYVVAGLQLTPSDATFTEQRDAILAAAASDKARGESPQHISDVGDVARGTADFRLLAEAFARRGAGSCAIAPPRDSTNFVGVVESTELKPRLAIGAITVQDAAPSCDRDGYLDAGEGGRVTVNVINAGAEEAKDTTITIRSTSPGVTFPRGNVVRLPRLLPMSNADASVAIVLDSAFSGAGQLALEITVANGHACEPVLTRNLFQWINVDDLAAISKIDSVESGKPSWSRTGAGAEQIWSRVEVPPLNHAWLGSDLSGITDTHLESPQLNVSATEDFVIRFDHAHSFEASAGQFFDGGVIEISRDGGVSWEDITTYAVSPYGGVLAPNSAHPLNGRAAFVARSPAWPSFNTVTLNLARALAGQTVKVRFRIGTDQLVGDFGWALDNLDFRGITNTPFSGLIADQTVCRGTSN